MSCKLCMHSSANLLEAPIILVDLTALSLEIKTRFLTFWLIEAFATASVPKTLFLTPSQILASTKETCL